MEHRAGHGGDVDAGLRGVGRGVEAGDEAGVFEVFAVDGDDDVAGVVAVAAEHGLQSVDVAAGARDEGEAADRGGVVQRNEGGGFVQDAVECGVAGGFDFDIVMHGVGSAGDWRTEDRHRTAPNG